MISQSAGSNRVAVIGMACRFPGARNPGEFWRNLRDGVESISFFTPAELKNSGVSEDLLRQPGYVPAKAILDDAVDFDYAHFGMTPREAEIMDPQHRLFLECAWEALEDAGYDFEARGARAGVYGGSAMSTWLLANVLTRPDLTASGGLPLRLGNGGDFLTTQVSYRLNLKGPSVTVQTACSTALVAVHLACQGLLDGECDMALAGGVAISFPVKCGYLFQEGGIWSPDGHCRPFDERAHGTVEGNGAGIVALKRLEDALADGDEIHAVIAGSAVNNDGAMKVGYAAPSVETQKDVVMEALAMAQAHPESIGFVEAHGSGTPLGDPIEVRALTEAYRASTPRKGYCYLGSVKSNIGHLDNAAGAASLIKTILAVEHAQIPPTLHFERPNPRLVLETSPFVVNSRLAEWPGNSALRRAGVSSLGIGGTNVHMVLEEAPARPRAADAERWKILPLSARTVGALDECASRLAAHLRANPGVDLADVAYTLGTGRRQFGYRRAVVAENADRAAAELESPAEAIPVEPGEHGIAFLFPGLGDHMPGMAAGLYRSEPGFRDRMDECASILKPLIGVDIRDPLFSPEAVAAGGSAAAANGRLRLLLARPQIAPDGPLARTLVAQPAVFSVEYALTGLLSDWGIVPEALIGYSIGEYAAACAAGVFSLRDALKLVAARARLIEALPPGVMLAIPAGEDEIRECLGDRVSVCATNGPSLTVAGGTEEAVTELEARLAAKGVACRRLVTSHAFHSHMMDPAMDALAREAAAISLHAPRVPYLSNVTGSWIPAADATSPAYWARHMRHTVRFGEGLSGVLANPGRILLEVGPGQALSTLARQHPDAGPGRVVVAAMRDRGENVDDSYRLRAAVAKLWVAGARIERASLWPRGSRRRVCLPTYPFQRERCWVEPGPGLSFATGQSQSRREPTDISNWFYVPVWRPVRLPPANTARKQHYLVIGAETDLGAPIVARLRSDGHRVRTVDAGLEFQRGSEDRFTIRPDAAADYKTLIQHLEDSRPERIIHLWATAPAESWDRERGFSSLLFLAQALGERSQDWPVRIDVVSNTIHSVTGTEAIQPDKAAVLGPVKVIPQEYADVSCRNIDLDGNVAIEALARELSGDSGDPTIAWRGPRRWTRSFLQTPYAPPPSGQPLVRAGGVYLIAGGLSGAGLALAEHLSRSGAAHLVLTADPAFPPPDKWERWLQSHDDRDLTSRSIRRLRALEFSGCDTMIRILDIAEEAAVRILVQDVIERFGRLDGVIHAEGPAGAGLLQLKTLEMTDAVLTPKLDGALVLERATWQLPLDFFVLCSSITSVTGGVGQVDTCAANAALDALAHRRSNEGRCFTATIDWSPFEWDTWNLPAAPGGWTAGVQSAFQSSGIDSARVGTAFDCILSSGQTQTIVCPHDLHTAIQQTDSMTASKLAESMTQTRPGGTHQRPQLANSYAAPSNPTEEKIASLWARSFGLESVGVHDNFFDLAGNSLLAIQIVTQLRAAFQVDLPMTALFESPTVAGLSHRVEELSGADRDGRDLAELLDEVERLSPIDAARLLQEEKPD